MPELTARRRVWRVVPMAVVATVATVAALFVAPQAVAAPAGPAAAAAAQMPAGLYKVDPPAGAAASGVGTTAVIIAGPIKNADSARCIGIAAGRAGVWTCSGNSDQFWHFATDQPHYCGSSYPYYCWYSLRNGDGKCLALEGNNTYAGTRALGFNCEEYSPGQFWRPFLPDADGNELIGSLAGYYTSSSWVLGVEGGHRENGSAIILWWSDGTQNQRWNLP
ncbi:RICIN domain-containing protein [Dactylosporangium siamense]|uniref:Ricin B lectin domain-containing protein n=1 Tax=Dactylosporangium siamense TaxID=685454 RepID=A0A919U9T8_9ACTN|nr:RICIN domain-containing protein [Dactylosporangium siamense]GIG43691.1 hypothetical protein Dsi01nite_017320 [Dactylosporangium siamense]